MTTEKNMMSELHKIRERFYEETKHMTLEERLEYEKRDVAELAVKYGFRLRRPTEKVVAH